MNRALFSGLSSTKAQQLKMDVTANNLANVSTVGYKGARVSFRDAFYQNLQSSAPPQSDRGGKSGMQVGTGVEVGSISPITTQGTMEHTGQDLDAAIDGPGFFVLDSGKGPVYSREGIFEIDTDNNMVAASTGYICQGWVAQDGQVDTSQTIGNITFPMQAPHPPQATDAVTLTGNLNTTADVGDTYSCSTVVYDSLGAEHTVDMTFEKTAAGAWDVSASCEGTTANGGVTFDANGTITAGMSLNMVAPVPGNANDLDIDIDLTNTTQYAQRFDVAATDQTGYSAATLLGVSVGDRGVITGKYSDGRTQTLGQLALATFPNRNALAREGKNLYTTTAASGSPRIGPAGASGTGDVVPQALEMSNTDLTSAFMDMLITQRAYQASTRIITTADSLIQEAIRLMK